MSIYKHLNQSNSEIRLVRLPTTADLDAQLSLELRHASRGDINYSALSYVWGDVNRPTEILVNGVPLQIGTNLYLGLRQLQKNGVRDWLWIDSLCIQQSDTEEKSSQVSQMSKIFSEAERVYSWLGPGSRESDSAMDFISRVGPRAVECKLLDLDISGRGREDFKKFLVEYISLEDRGTEHPRASEGYASQYESFRFLYSILHENELQDKPAGENWVVRGFSYLMNRDYWHRIWINQEIALAKEVIVLCGTKRTHMDELEAVLRAVDYCNRLLCYLKPVTHNFTKDLDSNFYINLPLDTRDLHRDGSPIHLCYLLFMNVSPAERPLYSATDPRDIIFALLGVITDNDELGLRPDYSLSTREVFTAATRALIDDGGEYICKYNLDSWTPRKDSSSELPSWVPDWRDIGNDGSGVDHINYGRYFNATDKITRPHPMREKGDDATGILRRHGCRVDVITDVLGPVSVEVLDGELIKVSSELVLQRILDFVSLRAESGPGEDYVWRTVLAKSWYEDINTNTEQEILCLIRNIMRQRPTYPASLSTAQQKFVNKHFWWRKAGTDVDSEAGRVNYITESLQYNGFYISHGRTLFKTAKSMLGSADASVRPGDVVTLIWGVPSPIVLRPRSDEEGGGFTFFGDAYVDGIMHGEFLATNPEHEEFLIY